MKVNVYERAHLDGVLELCVEAGWRSLPDDPERAHRALTADGVTSVVAVDSTGVLGFAQLLSDGEIQTYLALLVVRAGLRGRGIARALLAEGFDVAGGLRIDLLSEDAAEAFYSQLHHRRRVGYRIYPPFR